MFLTQRARNIAGLLAAFSVLTTVAYADSDSDSDSAKRYGPPRAERRIEKASGNVAVPVDASAAEPAKLFLGSVSCDTQSRASQSRVWEETALSLDRAVSPSESTMSGRPEAFPAVQVGGLAGSLVRDRVSQMTISISQRSSHSNRLRGTLDFEVSADPDSGRYDESGQWIVGVDGQGKVTLRGYSFARFRAGADGWRASCRWDLTAAKEAVGPVSLKMIENLFTPPTAEPVGGALPLLGSTTGGCGGGLIAASDAGWVAAGFLGFIPGASQVLTVEAVGTSIAGSKKGNSCLTTTLDNMNQQLATQAYQIQQIEDFLFSATTNLLYDWFTLQVDMFGTDVKSWNDTLNKISPSSDGDAAFGSFMSTGLGLWDACTYPPPEGYILCNPNPSAITDPKELAESLDSSDLSVLRSQITGNESDFFGWVNEFSGTQPVCRDVVDATVPECWAIPHNGSYLLKTYAQLFATLQENIDVYIPPVQSASLAQNVVPLYDQYNSMLVNLYQRALVGLQQAFTMEWLVNQINYFRAACFTSATPPATCGTTDSTQLPSWGQLSGTTYTYDNGSATAELQAYNLAQEVLARVYAGRVNQLYVNTLNYVVSDGLVAPPQTYPTTPFTYTHAGHGLAYVQAMNNTVYGSWSATVNAGSGTWTDGETFTTSGGAEGKIITLSGDVLTFVTTGAKDPKDSDVITTEGGGTGTLADPTPQVAWNARAEVGDPITFDGQKYYQIASIPKPWELTLNTDFAESDDLGTGYAITRTTDETMDYAGAVGNQLPPAGSTSTSPSAPDQGATPLSLVPPVANGSWRSAAALYQFSGLHDVATCTSNLNAYNAATALDPTLAVTLQEWLEKPGECPPIFTTPVLYAEGDDGICNTAAHPSTDDNTSLFGPDGVCGRMCTSSGAECFRDSDCGTGDACLPSDDLTMPFYDGNTLAPYTSFQAASNSTGGPMVLTGMMTNLKFCDSSNPALGWYAPAGSRVNNAAGLMANTAYLNCGNWYRPKWTGGPGTCGFPRASCPPTANLVYGQQWLNDPTNTSHTVCGAFDGNSGTTCFGYNFTAEIAAVNNDEHCSDNLYINGNEYPWILSLTDSFPTDTRSAKCGVIYWATGADSTQLSPIYSNLRIENGSYWSGSSDGCSLGFLGHGVGNPLPGLFSNYKPGGSFNMQLPNATNSGGQDPSWSGWVLPLGVQAYCEGGSNNPVVDLQAGIYLGSNGIDYAGYTCIPAGPNSTYGIKCTILDGTQYILKVISEPPANGAWLTMEVVPE